MRNSKSAPTLYLCDFGFGVRRYDIANLSFHENINEKTGDFQGIGVSFPFAFLFKPGFLKFHKRLEKLLKGGDNVWRK
jgi:hypothetical protein